jgi:hypothetical protein
LKRKESQKLKRGPEPELGVKVEKKLADWIVEMFKRNMCPSVSIVRLKAFKLAGIDPKEALADKDDADERRIVQMVPIHVL